MTSALEHGTEDTPGRLGAVLRAVGEPRPCALGPHGPWLATTLRQARVVLTDTATYDFPVDVSRRAVSRAEATGRSPHETVAPLSRECARLAARLFRAELDDALAGGAPRPHDAMELLRLPVARSTVLAVRPDLDVDARNDVSDAVLAWVDALGPVISSARPLRRWSRGRRGEETARRRLESLLDGLGDPAPPRTATVLAAGTQVPIAAGAWLLVALAERPALQSELRIGAVAADALVWEVLRLAPPTWITARVTRRATVLEGVPVPEGAVVLVSPLQLGRLTDLVPVGENEEDPERGTLDPRRWQGGPARPGSWLPFGAGPHACPGRTVGLAQLEALASWAASRDIGLAAPVGVDQSRGIFPRPALIEVGAAAGSGG
jgi:hypothetical protein